MVQAADHYKRCLSEGGKDSKKAAEIRKAMKSATLETGLTINVPLFVEEGDLIKVDTRTGEYLGRS